MTIELNPLGVTCDLACAYCYLHPQRDAGNFGPKVYDMERMKAGLAAEGGAFTLHGGDPLQMDIADIEEIWRWGFERHGSNGVQTHGSTITDEHVELAKRFNVHVGISMDGPGDLNDLRWAGNLASTRKRTARSEEALLKLTAADVPCSVIIVLHTLNTDPARRDDFKAWLQHLDRIGVSSVRFHPMEVDHADVAAQYQPTIEQYIEFYRDLHEFMRPLRLQIDVLADIRYLLTGRDQHTTCTWNACDPLTTAAVQGIDGQGVQTNCGRTNKDGVANTKGEQRSYERNIALFHTPQQHGGCKDCEYFFACKGQCPGEAIDGDWRNRSSYCELYKALFGMVEAELVAQGVVPLSQDPVRHLIERRMLDGWKCGQNLSIHRALQADADCGCGPQSMTAHGDAPHGDSPHGDSHGDHTDASLV